MLSTPWLTRLVVIVVLCAPVALLGQSAAQAGVVAGAGAGAAPWTGQVRAAAMQPAPLVTDTGPADGVKAGLPAPVMSAAMAAANRGKQREAAAALRSITAAARRGGKCHRLSCLAGLPAARNLAATQQPQIRDYFCGPATLAEMLAQMGRKISQRTAARELRTTISGTDWSDPAGYPMPTALNRNQRKNAYVAVALPWSPSRAQVRTFEADLVTDINHHGGVPLAGNAYEVPGGPHLAGNPENQTIFHWIDIRGYQDSGAVTDYEDSVHDASSVGWPAPAYSSLSSATMAQILGARGYVW